MSRIFYNVQAMGQTLKQYPGLGLLVWVIAGAVGIYCLLV